MTARKDRNVQATLEVLRSAGTALISDVFDAIGVTPPVLANDMTYVGEAKPFAGPAYTITGETVRYKGGDRDKLGAIDNMPAGVVALWASNGARGVCCFGDLLGTSMQARGVAGVVVDGGVRDVAFLRPISMPVIAVYRTPVQGVVRWRVTASQVPVKVRGALTEWLTVSPGDILVSDADGALAVPASLLYEVARRVLSRSTTEDEARREIARGLPLLEALQKYEHL